MGTYRRIKKIGVPEPGSVPELYHLSPVLMETGNDIYVIGNQTSGEAGVVLKFDETGEVSVTVGSDHTDRGLETVSIQKSKQVCSKPLAEESFSLEEVEAEWDDLKLFSQVEMNGSWIDYQDGKVSAIISRNEIYDFLTNNDVTLKNVVVFCGIVPLLDGFKYGSGFRCGITSKELNRTISIEYKINLLKES